ncbi:hypothetical protein J4050_11120 [Winogradskyella sp. DF17]|uniref:GLPGLI family protein n=1 Tax=Winogradskyella pelagia TaxID=2819984 RepID=A0ABS3T3I3_9FLAO|nr:hypothetical protein [Winogradskyella sp. DF17]MBO3117303.1 hypothetical protein [Winogradskyella sp. DF17]
MTQPTNANYLRPFVAALFVAFFLFGNAQKKKVAVVSFFVDKTIDLSEVDASADFIAQNTSLSDNPSFNLSKPLSDFYDAFFSNYVSKFEFELIPEEKVLKLPEYQDYEAQYGGSKNIGGQDTYEQIDGYKVVQNYGKRTEVKKLKPIADALGADAIMFIKLMYKFKRTGIGSLGYYSIQAIVSIDLFSKDNKSIFQFNELAGSKKKAMMIGGIPVMTPEEIQPMCESATEELIKDMNKKITRLSKKANKKLK